MTTKNKTTRTKKAICNRSTCKCAPKTAKLTLWQKILNILGIK